MFVLVSFGLDGVFLFDILDAEADSPDEDSTRMASLVTNEKSDK